MIVTVEPAELRTMLHDGRELALVDVREQGEFGEAHLFHAVNLPLSRLELQAPALLPRRSVRIVLCADGGPLSQGGRDALARMGYDDIRLLAGGPREWEAGGFEIYSGVYVPSKAFGEAVEHHYGTPSVSAEELHAMQSRGEKLVVLDSRPIGEFRNMSIPGAIDCPGAELAYRVHDLVPDSDTTVVVNCAGRTRSIIGAQSLINAGIANRVLALRNGTMGWHLAGFELDRGKETRYPGGDPRNLDRALAVRQAVTERFGVNPIDAATLSAWQKDETRSLFLLDVRDPAEYAAGHLPGSRSAPGGQLVQATDTYIGVRGGRVVLVDDTGVRATMTAHWLLQIGYDDVHVLDGGVGVAGALETGPESGLALPDVPVVAAQELAGMLDAPDLAVIDVSESRVFRAGHVPGAVWAVRTRIASSARTLPSGGRIVVASEDGRLARLAVDEVRGLCGGQVMALEGGMQAWRKADLAVEADRTYPADEDCVDVYLRAYDRNSRVEEKMNEYLEWEVNLVRQIERDPDVGFRLPPQ